ncbi:MAG TPA: S41 family peptidase [Candidatus Acidoferrales bacterium]|nr:S41 family peptidase [Candidatus Acidoferrales bacterium]
MHIRKPSYVLAAFLLLLASPSIFVGGPLAQREQLSSIDQDRDRGILRDAYDAVKKHYYDPTYHGVDLDARYRQCEDKIKAAPVNGEAFRWIAAFLGGLNDSHTFFVPPARTSQVEYGFRMQVFGDDVFVTHVRPGTDAESKVHPGDQITLYQGFSVNRRDFHDLSYYLNSLSPLAVSQLNLRDPDGGIRQVSVNSKLQQGRKVLDFTSGGSDVWQYIREEENRDHLVRQQYVEIGDVMIWKMPEFFLEDSEVDRFFGVAQRHRTLILDLRGNPGGAITTLERMVGNVFDHDLKIADRIARKEQKPQIAKTRGDRAFGGRMIVLVDSRSASAAELFARVTQLEHRGTVLGDRTSGSVMEARIYRYSQGMDTKIFYAFSVTDADLVMNDGRSLEHVGVTPDEIVLPSAQDLADNRDPVLARAAGLAGLKMNTSEAAKLFPLEWLPLQ